MEVVLSILSSIFWVLIAITILVFVHEMGHFLTAKWFKMRVDKFSVGFPPKIFSRQIGETEYVLGATPLGGYVKIAGMVDESMDTEFANSEPQPWEFRSKPVWQRIIVITAGVFFNVVLAVIIFSCLKFFYGEPYIPADRVEQVHVATGSPAHVMGLRTGDRVVSVSGKKLERFHDLDAIESILADPMTVTVLREGQELTFQGPDDIMTQLGRARPAGFGVTFTPSIIGGVSSGWSAAEAGLQPFDRVVGMGDEPVNFWAQMTELIQSSQGDSVLLRWSRPDSLFDASVDMPATTALLRHENGFRLYEAKIAPRLDDGDSKYKLGVFAPSYDVIAAAYGRVYEHFGLFGAINAGMRETWINASAIVTSLQRVFSGREDLRENLGGPVMVAKVTRQAAEAGAYYFWQIVAVLSITLAIMNILPIPVLDGGHLVFLIYEGITRREPSLKVRMWLQQIGMILLLLFMTFLVFNDILRL
ncbi:MAG: RIP metalloprotease RseP [Rhodothermales bacterium]|nr:RIP metalloprotease RseP [Rhodothermales bacterium]